MLSLLLATTLMTQIGAEQPGRGISEALARERASTVGSLRYEVTFVVPADLGDPVRGRVILRFTLEAPHRVVVDFAQPRDQVLGVQAGGSDVLVTFGDGHLTIPAQSTRAGENEFSIDFIAGDDSFNRDRESLYTLFVPRGPTARFPASISPT